MTKQELTTAAIDLFGYSEDDFEDMTYQDILDYLTDAQIDQVHDYVRG